MKQKTEGVHLWLLLWKAYKSVETIDLKSIQSLGFKGLSDFAILEVLYHKGPLPVSAIGEKVMLTSGSITTAIDRAENNGLVSRTRDDVDGRIVIVNLTVKGRNQIESIFITHAQNLDPIFKEFSMEDRQTLARLLKKAGFAAKALNL
tara:strand:- start:545 stop:988 length:444 start_codon:yes stop_codon:yes gene_type:complete